MRALRDAAGQQLAELVDDQVEGVVLDADVATLQGWVRLFETAMREARRVATEHSNSVAPSTHPSMWQTSALPGDERDK